MSKLVSIIVPIYNMDQYLKQCIESLIKQTYKNIEIILVDDGSTDKSPQICCEYAKKDSRITVHHKKNRGVSSARNRGLDCAHGYYIMFVDADDYVELDLCQVIVGKMEEYSVNLVCYKFDVIDERGSRVKEINKVVSNGIHQVYEVINEFVDGSIDGGRCVWSKLFKRELIGAVRFEETIFYGEDFLFFFLYLRKIENLYMGDAVKYHYRSHAESAMFKMNEKRLTVIEMMNEILEINFQFNKTTIEYLRFYQVRTASNYLAYATVNNVKSKENKKIAKKVLRKYYGVAKYYKEMNMKKSIRFWGTYFCPKLYIGIRKILKKQLININ